MARETSKTIKNTILLKSVLLNEKELRTLLLSASGLKYNI
jgi:hypothetical protein